MVAVALSSAPELTFDAVTLAVLVSVPGLVAVTPIVIVALAPLESPPRLRVTVPP